MDPAKVAHVRILAGDVRTHMPDARLYVLAREGAELPTDDESITTVRADRFAAPDAPDLKPLFLKFLLESEESVVLLDPEARVFGNLGDVEDLARAHGIVLVPTVLWPVPLDAHSPSEPDLQAIGIHNAGCIAVGRSAGPFLDWHAEHLRDRPELDLASGWSLDDRWIDFVPAYFDHHLLRDPGVGVGLWNLHERRVVEADGGYLAADAPLRLFNFRGLDPDRPSEPSHAFRSRLPLRARPAEQPAVLRLCESYAAALRG